MTGFVELSSPRGRAVVLAATLGSGMAMLDGTVVNVALRELGTDLDASLAQLQWITNGYFLTLAGLILLGGALGDRWGRRRVFELGVVLFAVSSLLCGLAPTAEVLIGARVVQGIGGALLTPGSLAILQSVFVPADRARAIGTWSGMASFATAFGPLFGGLLIEVSWRLIFLINLPLAVLTLVVARRAVPETRDESATGRFDVVGAVLAVLALGSTTYGLIEWGRFAALWLGLGGLALMVFFVWWERRTPRPMMPTSLFGSVQFSAANAMTFVVYAALGAMMFFLVLQLQTSLGWSPLAAGLATLPISVCMLLLAGRGGAYGERVGPRIPMTVGPLVMAFGTAWLALVDAGDGYVLHVLPGLVIFGLGLALMVAPLTATVLAAVPDNRAGVASGINNAVARAGSLLAVAALPVLVGLSGDDYAVPALFSDGYQAAMLLCAGLLAAGGLISWLLIRTPGQPAAR
ncbi:MAG: MFS transporter [Nocardioides sp.]